MIHLDKLTKKSGRKSKKPNTITIRSIKNATIQGSIFGGDGYLDSSWSWRCRSLKFRWCSDHLKNILCSYWWQYMFSLQSPIRGRGIFIKWLLHHISFNLRQHRSQLVTCKSMILCMLVCSLSQSVYPVTHSASNAGHFEPTTSTRITITRIKSISILALFSFYFVAINGDVWWFTVISYG